MSSTNRGYEREKTDYYVTPRETVKTFLNEWFCDLQNDKEYNFVCERPDKVEWLDPCAGGDKEHLMSYAFTISEMFESPVVDTIDIREDSLASEKGDYLKMEVAKYDVIISNPPFMHAEAFIRKALEDVKEDGYVVMLLRLNFLGSKSRFQLFKDYMPERIYVHHRRMSFTDDGKTDSIEYAHFVWRKGWSPKEALLKVI